MKSGKAFAVSLVQTSPSTSLTGLRLAIAGAGVFGLCTALKAAAAGADVEVWDPAPVADNASGVAAGMIAPAGEILFDPVSVGRQGLFQAARDAWCDVQALAPALVLNRTGAIFAYADAASQARAFEAAASMGLGLTEPPDPSPTRWRAPGPALFAPGDWRVDAPRALLALRAAIVALGGRFRRDPLGLDHLQGFDAVVAAAGMASSKFVEAAPELAALSPIKGQIVRFNGGPSAGPTIRAQGIYLVPRPDGLLAGATMEPGVNDRLIDPQTVNDLKSRAARLIPALGALNVQGYAGVRASTPDGLPMAGPSSRPGLHLATGARRNGWLLAPLVGGIVVSYLSGGDGGVYASTLNPRRFDAS